MTQSETPGTPFSSLPLDDRILKAVATLGFTEPTPIQLATLAPLLEGRDLIGRARTGSGKTAAFGLPLLERLKDGGRGVRALLLAPTRELALQVTDALRSFATSLPLRVVTVYGGAPYEPQLRALRDGAQIVVGTPGRVIDHLKRGSLDLGGLELLILDEADEMLRMGFIDDVEQVMAAAPPGRQIALFSASMPQPIKRIAATYLKDPVEVQVEKRSLTVEHISQAWIAVPHRHKGEALARILAAKVPGSTLVFVRTRAGCAEAADELARLGLSVDALHGDLNQAARERVLERFRAKKLDVVVATDVAARGIDVDHITHVVNYDMPEDEEVYTHRIGRCGRAGRSGQSITFVLPVERRRIERFERTLGVRILPLEVPSDANITAARLDRLKDQLVASLEHGVPPALDAFIDETFKDLDDRTLAAGALRLLAEREGLDFTHTPDAAPPAWARPPRREPREMRDPRGRMDGGAPAERRPRGPGDVDEANAVELFFPAGRRRGVEPKHVVAALTNTLGVPSRHIGRIQVEYEGTYARVSAKAAAHVLAEGKVITLRGHKGRLVESRPADEKGRAGKSGGGDRSTGGERSTGGDRSTGGRGGGGDRAAGGKRPIKKGRAKAGARRG